MQNDRKLARLEWANANMRATLERLRRWAAQDPTGPVDAHGVAAWVRSVIDHGLETGNPDMLPDLGDTAPNGEKRRARRGPPR